MSVAFSPGGSYLATRSWSNTACLWDVAAGQEVRALGDDSIKVFSIAFSPDGKILATGEGENAARLWDVATGQEVRRFTTASFPDADTEAVAFSPDGRLLATASGDKAARLWDVATGREIRAFTGHSSALLCLAFSPDGFLLATGSYDDSARLWDVATGREVLRFTGHTGEVCSITFSPDGKLLATCSWDKTARLWNPATGEELRRFELPGRVHSVAFSPDGKYLVAGSSDGTTRLWDVATGRELCQLLSFDDGCWAVVDPEGRYDASSDDIAGLVWVVGNEPIALSQLKDRYYEPGLLAKVLDFNKEPLRDVTPFREVGLPPLVEVIPPAKGSSTATVKLTARDGGLGRVVFFVNGSEFVADARKPGMDPKAPRATLPVDLTYAPALKPGDVNALTAVAYTETEPRIASRRVSVPWKAPGAAQSGRPRLFAIVAGVSDYAGEDLDLKYAGQDAVAVYTALQMAANNLYGPENVDIRLFASSEHPKAEKPVKAAIAKALVDFRASRPDDTVLIYLAGHGLTLTQGQDTYCYLTEEARSAEGVLHDPAVRKQWAITSNELAEWIKRIPALKRVVVLDTCSAGSAGDILTLRREVPGDQLRAMALLQGRVGTQILMGCAADAVSYEATRFGQGLVTYAVLDGVRGAALQNEEFIDVATLFRYVSEAVPKLAGGLGGIQKPDVRSTGQSFSVGRMLPEDKARVPIGMERPLVLRPVFLDQDTGDRLRLVALVREKLLALDWAGARGEGAGPGLGYVDADEMPGGVRPRGTYTVEKDQVRVHLVVWKDDQVLKTEDIIGTAEALDNLVDRVVQGITSAGTPNHPEPTKAPGSNNGENK